MIPKGFGFGYCGLGVELSDWVRGFLSGGSRMEVSGVGAEFGGESVTVMVFRDDGGYG